MFLPIGDDQEHERTPIATYALIAANVIAFLAFCLPHPRPEVMDFGAYAPATPQLRRFFTSMFLHHDLLHLAGNMLFLWIFGRLAEERFGRIAFPLFYLASGLAALVLHGVTTRVPEAPVIGASGAVSGAVGAALVFCPRAHIKVWLFWWGVYEIPAIIWIALWFAEQVYFSSRDYGNVAYYAHLGGFACGAGLAWIRQLLATRARARRARPVEPKDSSSLAEPRRPFREVHDSIDPVFLDGSIDSYAVVTLEDASSRAEEISRIAPGSRIPTTHGVVARSISRAEADRLRGELQTAGIPSALIADVPANYPPSPERAESASWDDRLLRFRLGNQSIPVSWSAPFVFVAASADGETFIDLFVSGKSAFRVRKSTDVSITRVDVRRRSEESTDLSGLARDILQARPSASNEGVRRLAEGRDLAWLAFRSRAEYDDYLFWTYNLALSKVSTPGT